jgi:hypothetical protein
MAVKLPEVKPPPCPECGSRLRFGEGCAVCPTCGYSRCQS